MKHFFPVYLKGISIILLFTGLSGHTFSQVGVTNDPSAIAPQSLLHVHSNAASGQVFQLTNTTSGYTLPTQGFSIVLDPNFKTIFKNQYSNSGASISFSTNDGSERERMTIRNNGNVGIGNGTPAYKLTVAGQLGLLETGSLASYFTVLQSGNLSSSLTFTLPSDYGSSGQVLTTDATGNMSWSSGETPLVFSNGITRSLSEIKWGGPLTGNTTISQSGTQTLNFLNAGTANTIFNLSSTGDFDIQDNGTSTFFVSSAGKIGIGDTSPIHKLDITGELFIEYPGSLNGFYLNGSTSMPLATILNSTTGNGAATQSGCTSSASGATSKGVYGYNNGPGFGLYGTSASGTGVYGKNITASSTGELGTPEYGVRGDNGDTYGYLASTTWGAYGLNGESQSFGILGGFGYGVLGKHGTSANHGYLGTPYSAVEGDLETREPGCAAISGRGALNSGENGTGYGMWYTIGGVRGYSSQGNEYTFGVMGYSYLDENRSGSNLGAIHGGTLWGCLGYKNSGGTSYGGYFTSSANGTGKTVQAMVNSGIGVWGDLFGADIHGKVYGAYIEGTDYATYANGDVFKNGLDVHLQKEQNGENITLYTHVSTDVTVQTCGYATLANGNCDVEFDPSFVAAVSSNSPVIVTITPMGNTGGVYLSKVSTGGFKAVENNNGKSTVQLSYIAIGKRAGHEQPRLPGAVIAGDYTAKIAHGLQNDNNVQTSAQGLYYEDGKLHVAVHPSTLPDPGTSRENPRATPPLHPDGGTK